MNSNDEKLAFQVMCLMAAILGVLGVSSIILSHSVSNRGDLLALIPDISIIIFSLGFLFYYYFLKKESHE